MGVDFFFPQADAKEFSLQLKCNFCNHTVVDHLAGRFTDDTSKKWNQYLVLSAKVICMDCSDHLTKKLMRLP